MTTSVSSSTSMPTWRMPPPPRSQESTSTDSTTTSTTDASASAPEMPEWDPEANGGTAPEGFEGFEGKFPNFGGGNMGAGMMPPFGQRETFL
ncbi:hypothetical protein H4S14_001472 [Agrobacterium vitis]|nr:hypothetical protein [Agrobacterium vitis]MBE1437734.1 hypothetical protein [Agrobacterium vitis]